MKIAMIAPPWLMIPPKGYGGIEVVVDGLLSKLVKRGAKVDLFSVSDTKVPRGVTLRYLYTSEQYKHIHRPMYESLPILGAHIQFALNQIMTDGDFDVIHDHNGFYGPQLLSWAVANNRKLPPTIHTYHGPPFSNKEMLTQDLPDNRPFWQQLGEYNANIRNRFFIVGISNTLMKSAPTCLQPLILDPVYNAVELSRFPFVDNKKNYFITLARFARDKGQHLAAELCVKLGYRLRMAGTISSIGSKRQLQLELANPTSQYRNTSDFRYYSDYILSYTIHNSKLVTYEGNISGNKKLSFISQARALLFPISWNEPFGMAVIEALACGTPVIAMNRGAMPEIIEHGVNGFLANNKEEFEAYMQKIDEINPNNCRKSVTEKFSADVMADSYFNRYKEAIQRSNINT